MNDLPDIALIRSIAREQCELEAASQRGMTHTAIEKLPADELSDAQCVLLWAIGLERHRRDYVPTLPDGRPVVVPYGTPDVSVNPFVPIHVNEAAEREKRLEHLIRMAASMRAHAIEPGRFEKYIDSCYEELDSLSVDGPIDVPSLAVWAWLAAQENLLTDGVEGRAKSFVVESISQTKETELTKNNTQTNTRTKLSNTNQSKEPALISAIIAHHQYDNGSVLNWDPIGSNALAEEANVGKGTASKFFKKWFGTHDRYKKACISGDVGIALRQLAGESILKTFGSDPEQRNTDS